MKSIIFPAMPVWRPVFGSTGPIRASLIVPKMPFLLSFLSPNSTSETLFWKDSPILASRVIGAATSDLIVTLPLASRKALPQLLPPVLV